MTTSRYKYNIVSIWVISTFRIERWYATHMCWIKDANTCITVTEIKNCLATDNGVQVICQSYNVPVRANPRLNHRLWLEIQYQPIFHKHVSRLVVYYTGVHFTNDFLPAIQIRWKLRLAVIPLLAIRSRQIFAHATTAQLSWHVQTFVAITVLESRWE